MSLFDMISMKRLYLQLLCNNGAKCILYMSYNICFGDKSFVVTIIANSKRLLLLINLFLLFLFELLFVADVIIYTPIYCFCMSLFRETTVTVFVSIKGKSHWCMCCCFHLLFLLAIFANVLTIIKVVAVYYVIGFAVIAISMMKLVSVSLHCKEADGD